jgi:signal transduction histidine kinase
VTSDPKVGDRDGETNLGRLIVDRRDDIIARAQAKVSARSASQETGHDLCNGVPLFLTQLGAVLGRRGLLTSHDESDMVASASLHGRELLSRGFTIGEVVHDYGDVCQAITELAQELRLPLSSRDLHALNRCLDNATADAVTEHVRQHEADVSEMALQQRGFFAHELRGHLGTAWLAFEALKLGKLDTTGPGFEILARSLGGLRELIERSVSEVRATAGENRRERVRVYQMLEQMRMDASVDVKSRGLQFSVECVDEGQLIDIDRHDFCSAISNLLRNAFKFTRPQGSVWLRSHATSELVSFEVEDECGGLPDGAADAIFEPFEQRGLDRNGLGLGLAISRQAVEQDGGRLSVRDRPGKGCVFVIEMPRASSAQAPADDPVSSTA